ncbi:MAG TPA: S1 RNA-binding domain-containing protein, partial [Planctomycetota bacterium]
YGAFVEIEDGIDGLLHNTDFHWTRKIQHPSEMVRKGDRIQCVVLAVDREKQRISLGMKQLTKNPWEDYIPANYHVGDVMAGTLTKNISSGAFVKLEEELEAFMHYSTLPHEWQGDPEGHCIPGLKCEVRVTRVDCGEERIGLAFLHADFEENDDVIAKWNEAQERKKARKAAKEAKKKDGDDDDGDDDGEHAADGPDEVEAPEGAFGKPSSMQKSAPDDADDADDDAPAPAAAIIKTPAPAPAVEAAPTEEKAAEPQG